MNTETEKIVPLTIQRMRKTAVPVRDQAASQGSTAAVSGVILYYVTSWIEEKGCATITKGRVQKTNKKIK